MAQNRTIATSMNHYVAYAVLRLLPLRFDGYA